MRNKILVVDDDKEFREEFRQCFKEYEIVQASSGEEAISILRKPNEIGLVLLDVKLPGMRGTDALIRMKSISPDLNVVILTGCGSEDIAVKALKGHADDYIEKPFEVDQMKELIEKMLSGNDGHWAESDDADEKIGHIKEFVERNCMKKISLVDAAKAVALCPKYVSRMFKKVTGMRFVEYRISVQMKRAKEMLAAGTGNVNEISDRLGYQNPESFIRQFKQSVGCTPAEYREKKRKGKK